MKVHHITEAPKTSPGDRIEPKLNIGSGSTTSSDGKPLKGQSLKLNGVNYQWKGANWIVTDTSEFKGKNPPKKGAIADRNARALLNQQAASLNGGSTPKKVDPPKAVSSNIDGGGEDELKSKLKADKKAKVKEDGWIKKIWNTIKNSKIGKLLGWLLSRPVATAVIAALNFAQLEDALDAYLRALTNHGKKLESQEAKKQYIENAIAGRLPQKVAEAYLTCLEKFAKLIVEAVVAALVSGAVIGGAGGALAGLATIIGTGPVGWIVAILTGGALIWGGTALVGKILDAIGFNDIVEIYVVKPILSPAAMLSTGETLDGFQEIIGYILDAGNAWDVVAPLVPRGDLVRDSIELDEGYVLISEGKTIPSKSEIKSNLKALMKSEPKLAKAFNKGKQQGKAAINNLI